MRSREWILRRRAKALVGTLEDRPFADLRKLFTIEGEHLVTACRRSRFVSEDDEFKFRDIEIVCQHSTQVAAIAKLREWDTCDGYFSDGSSFVISADACSQSDYECAEMLMDHWLEDCHPFDSGEPLIIFDRLVIAVPHPDIWPALIAAMAKAFKRRGGTMVLKAFPLEWEGAADGRPVAMESDFASRLAAMRRLYRRRLGMQDIPENEEGWMWKAIGHAMPPNPTRVRQPEEMTSDLEV